MSRSKFLYKNAFFVFFPLSTHAHTHIHSYTYTHTHTHTYAIKVAVYKTHNFGGPTVSKKYCGGGQ